MKNIKQLTEMMKLQDKLNNETNGSGWTSGTTKEGNEIDWYRCARMEAAELVDSFQWKHWKDLNGATDEANVVIELVDIWHFLMSINIGDKFSVEMIENVVVQTSPLLRVKHDRKSRISFIEDFMKYTFIYDTGTLNVKFFTMLFGNGVDMDLLYKTYIGKNVLNTFRQNNGYKVGTYIKNWDGDKKEDNEYLQDILNVNNDLTYDELYGKLEVIYIDEMKKLKPTI